MLILKNVCNCYNAHSFSNLKTTRHCSLLIIFKCFSLVNINKSFQVNRMLFCCFCHFVEVAQRSWHQLQKYWYQRARHHHLPWSAFADYTVEVKRNTSAAVFCFCLHDKGVVVRHKLLRTGSRVIFWHHSLLIGSVNWQSGEPESAATSCRILTIAFSRAS